MERIGRSRASIAVGAVVVLMAIVGATVAYRHIAADASSEGPMPANKRARLDCEAASRGHRRAPKAADPRTERPTSGPSEYETGIVNDDESPSREFVVRNRWGGKVQGHQYVVFAGARTSDASQGVLLVQEVTADGEASEPDPYEAPPGTGALRVVSVEGARLTLSTDSGTRYVFNMVALRFE
jgi:hypothetical protein